MNIYTLSLSLLHCSLQLGKSCSQDIPTFRYSMGYREIPGDLRRRRQNTRFKESISLKPPPPDWPSPTMGAADFLYDETAATPISPLQAYQAKLQEEYLRDQEEQSQKKITQPPLKAKVDESIWSSSEEEFKKLLDPNELLKLNKKLGPILNRRISSLKQGSVNAEEKPARMGQPTKAKGTKEKTTSAAVNQMKNENTIKSSERITNPAEEQEKRERKRKKTAKSKIGEDNLKTKKRRKKARKFAFDTHHSSESGRTIFSRSDENPRALESKESRGGTSSPSESSVSSEEVSMVTAKEDVYTFIKRSKATTEISERTIQDNDLDKTSKPKPFVTSTTSKILIETTSFTPTLPYCTEKTTEKPEDTTTISPRKMEVREKRKQIKQEMEKVLKEEQLEGSFGDRDSKWTTSETPKIPIINVTPHDALLGILKHKVVNFVDKILKSRPKLNEEDSLML